MWNFNLFLHHPNVLLGYRAGIEQKKITKNEMIYVGGMRQETERSNNNRTKTNQL